MPFQHAPRFVRPAPRSHGAGLDRAKRPSLGITTKPSIDELVAENESLRAENARLRGLLGLDRRATGETRPAWSPRLFGAEHEQWLAGLICGALYNGLLYRTKNLTDCAVAHATSNALLAAWVLVRGDWGFW